MTLKMKVQVTHKSIDVENYVGYICTHILVTFRLTVCHFGDSLIEIYAARLYGMKYLCGCNRAP